MISQGSWEDLTLWEDEVTQRVPKAQIVIVGNKTDLAHKRVIPSQVAHQWAQQRCYGYVETSCATAVPE